MGTNRIDCLVNIALLHGPHVLLKPTQKQREANPGAKGRWRIKRLSKSKSRGHMKMSRQMENTVVWDVNVQLVGTTMPSAQELKLIVGATG